MKRKIDPNNRPGRKYILGRPMTKQERNRRVYELMKKRQEMPPINKKCLCGNMGVIWNDRDAVCERCARIEAELKNRTLCTRPRKAEADKYHYVPITPKPMIVRITEAIHKMIIDAHGHYELTL